MEVIRNCDVDTDIDMVDSSSFKNFNLSVDVVEERLPLRLVATP